VQRGDRYLPCLGQTVDPPARRGNPRHAKSPPAAADPRRLGDVIRAGLRSISRSVFAEIRAISPVPRGFTKTPPLRLIIETRV
jgi:hypothetical protein